MRAVNLIPAKRIAARQRQRRIRRWIGGASAYAMLLVAAAAVAHAVWGPGEEALAERFAKIEADARAAQQQLVSLEPQLQRTERRLHASRAVAVQPDWSLLLAMLAEVRGEKVALNRIELRPGEDDRRWEADQANGGDGLRRHRLEIGGVGENQQAVSQFVLRLEQAEVFADVQLVETGRTHIGDEVAVSFSVLCLLEDQRHEGGGS